MSYRAPTLLDLIKQDLAHQWSGVLKNNYDEASRVHHQSVYDPPPLQLYEDSHEILGEIFQDETYEEQIQQEELDHSNQHSGQQYYAGAGETEPMDYAEWLYMQQPSMFIAGSESKGTQIWFDGEHFGAVGQLVDEEEEEEEEAEAEEPLMHDDEQAEEPPPEDEMEQLMLLSGLIMEE